MENNLRSRRSSTHSSWWVRRFRQFNRNVRKDQVGIYQFTFCTDIVPEAAHSHKSTGHRYQVFAKVKIKSIYDDNLVEVELVSLDMHETVNEDIVSIIKKTFNTYIDAKVVKWEMIEE